MGGAVADEEGGTHVLARLDMLATFVRCAINATPQLWLVLVVFACVIWESSGQTRKYDELTTISEQERASIDFQAMAFIKLYVIWWTAFQP